MPPQSPRTAALVRDRQAMLTLALRTAVGRLDPTNRRIAEYHLGFVDAEGSRTVTQGGKLIRGTLVMLSAAAVRADASAGVPPAVAVELVHNYSLLHDDIIDGDETRRHRATAWSVFGRAAAILAGDAMAALAVEVLTEAGTPASAAAASRLAEASRRMVAGQSADIAFETTGDVGLAQCRQMVADKTGALLSCAASLGAVAAGAPASVTSSLAEFGMHLGMAFQLVDDLLGIWGTEEVTGKPVASDLASRKRSLPVVAALEAGGPASDRLRALYAQDGPLTIEDLAAAAAAVEEAGGRAWATQEAERQTTAALTTLERTDIDDEVRAELVRTTRALCRRDH